ncbi:MAG: hypothetical protein IJ679_00305 [Lachnospiraceae bacterium]|nr:hypothetical protein [Lachnospiraceae bacterium]
MKNKESEFLKTLRKLIENQTDASSLSPEERQTEISIHLDRLKELRKVPRSDWHREFEDALQLDIEAWENGSWVIREHTLGEYPPRMDFIVVVGEKLPTDTKGVFRIFLRNNVIEFKGPGDKLDWLTLRKAIGYVNFYIATAKKEEGVTADNVTISIFASEKNENEFTKMKETGILSATDTPGVYFVNGLTDIPFQVVMLDELESGLYATYRVLKRHADIVDVEHLLNELEEADKRNDQSKMDRLHRILNLVENKNHGAVAERIQESETMKSVFMDVLKPEIDAMVAEDRAKTTMNNLFEYVNKGGMSLDFAAKEAGLTPQKFKTEMTAHGFKVPELV